MPIIGDTNECPRYHIDSTALQFQRLTRAYSRGFLPNEGGYLDQPHGLLSLFELYDRVTH